ncbi:hypothetical protein CDCA_CDCA03G0992 [Cyanidium caldarium]|uniref:RRM domain-containing protein n=1 Tax=Cyanidium caldarium TaxID=2771 RepID=A0AAV9IRU3_CYACA|nr:hypothetical protein CDCA_CDCA03G0992 [Cyanidium caldarium]
MTQTAAPPSSRLIVKGLPKYLTERRLREHFAQHVSDAELTDVRIRRTRDGRSRQFAFVGYRTAEAAAQSQKHFNRTFIDTSRIQVEVALPPGSEHAPVPRRLRHRSPANGNAADTDSRTATRPNERQTKAGSAEAAGQPHKRPRFVAESHFAEYAQVSQPRAAALAGTTDAPVAQDATEHTQVRKSTGSDAADGASETLPHGTSPANGRQQLPSAKTSTRPAEEPGSAPPDVFDTGRLFLRNLPYTATEEELESMFGSHGRLAEVHLVRDARTRQSTGTAFVMFVLPECAARAMAALDGTVFQGRLLHILPARAKRETGRENRSDAPAGISSFQRQRWQQRASAAGTAQDARAWNPLFMSADAVATAVTERLGVDKRALYDADAPGGGASGAVRLAIAETHLLREARQFLERAGVRVDALLQRQRLRTEHREEQRVSRRTMVVKNLPAGTPEAEVRALFARFGPLGRLVIVPSGLLAVVEMLEVADASRAFRDLAYSKFGDQPLYLEWAPPQVWRAEPAAGAAQEEAGRVLTDPSADTATADAVGGSLYVRNLSSNTTEETLAAFFGRLGRSLQSVRIPRRRVGAGDGTEVSMGFGFVEFGERSDALEALTRGHGAIIDGHRVEVRLSRGDVAQAAQRSAPLMPGASEPTSTRAAHGTKLVLKNVAFEASAKELRRLLGTFGHLASLRVPRKYDGSSRGFCFVEYATAAECRHAHESLQAVHFYGRKLVVERATDDEEENP